MVGTLGLSTSGLSLSTSRHVVFRMLGCTQRRLMCLRWLIEGWRRDEVMGCESEGLGEKQELVIKEKPW